MLKTVRRMKMIPSTKTAASAACQLYPIPITRVKAKKALIPMLGACAKGSLARKAIRSVPIADDSAVAVKTAPLSMPVTLRMSGFTARM